MKNFIAYDFETTGRDARFDQVLQAGLGVVSVKGYILLPIPAANIIACLTII